MTRRLSVLVVEDDRLVSDVIQAALEDDYDTTLVENSAEALQRLAQGRFDLLLLDCTLPGGLHADLIPQADQSSIPVILMSGDPAKLAQTDDKHRPFVLKPFTLKTLLDTLELAARDAPS